MSVEELLSMEGNCCVIVLGYFVVTFLVSLSAKEGEFFEGYSRCYNFRVESVGWFV
jgi:hypothetical protein